MKIQVLGTGCTKCKNLHENTRKAITELGVAADLEKVEDLRQIMKYNILMTPALVVDGVVKAAGRVLAVDEIKKILGSASAGGK